MEYPCSVYLFTAHTNMLIFSWQVAKARLHFWHNWHLYIKSVILFYICKIYETCSAYVLLSSYCPLFSFSIFLIQKDFFCFYASGYFHVKILHKALIPSMSWLGLCSLDFSVLPHTFLFEPVSYSAINEMILLSTFSKPYAHIFHFSSWNMGPFNC